MAIGSHSGNAYKSRAAAVPMVRARELFPYKIGSSGQIEPRLVLLDGSYIDELCRLEQRCYKYPWSSALIRGEFTKDVSLRLALIIPGQIVAYCLNYLVEDELHILNLAVNPDFRGRQHGRRMLQEVLRYSYKSGARRAFLEVRESNLIAQKLYVSAGFRSVGVRERYYRDNHENALVLERFLDASVF